MKIPSFHTKDEHTVAPHCITSMCIRMQSTMSNQNLDLSCKKNIPDLSLKRIYAYEFYRMDVIVDVVLLVCASAYNLWC